MLAAESIEAHNATEEDGHIVVSFGRHWALVSQLIGDRRRKDGIQQSVGIRVKHCKTRWEPDYSSLTSVLPQTLHWILKRNPLKPASNVSSVESKETQQPSAGISNRVQGSALTLNHFKPTQNKPSKSTGRENKRSSIGPHSFRLQSCLFLFL